MNRNMNRKRSYKISLISLFVAFMLLLGAAAFTLFNKTTTAYAAAYRTDADDVFSTSLRGATVTVSEPETEGEAQHRYTLFQIGEEETVSYRKNLAYSWIVGEKNEDGVYDGSGNHHGETFSMEIGFKSAAFKRFIIKFQSQQAFYKDGYITENYLVFTPAADNKINMAVMQDLEDEDKAKAADAFAATFSVGDRLTVSFGEYSDGGYVIKTKAGAETESTATGYRFENVYEPYAKYVGSGDYAVTPLTFSAEFEKEATEKSAEMVLYSINGQSFEQTDNNGDGNFRLNDDTPPVMCFNATPSYLEYGKSIGFDYQVIDVLSDSNPRSTAYFYVLTGEQYSSNAFQYDKTDYTEEEKKDETATEGEGTTESTDTEETDITKINPFIEASSSSNIRIITDDNTFVPRDMIDSDVHGLVKIYYQISDRSGSSAQKDTVFVDWYAKDSALVDVYKLKHVENISSKFFKLIDGKEGLTYAQADDLNATGATEDPVLDAYKGSVKAFQEAYQIKIDEAIKNLKDEDGEVVGRLYAGSDKRFYLPSFENLKDKDGNPVQFNLASLDEFCNARDYKYSIYYKANSKSSNTSLAANKLSISLNDADVTYRFTIYMTDAFGNPMRYPKTSEDGEIVWEEIDSKDVWNEEYAELLPFFEFDVSYKEATAKDPESLPIAYVNTSYSGVTFEITGVTNTYTSAYNLYIFDRDAMNSELGVSLGYDEVTKCVGKLIANDVAEIAQFKEKYGAEAANLNTRKYFTMVKPASSLLESDDNYELFKSINWNASNVSFTPQSVEDYYVVELKLTDNRSQTSPDKNYAVAVASIQAEPIKGENEWLKNNKTSIILLSIAGACLIALIVLLIVKPKDKGDIDAVYAEGDKKQKKSRKGRKDKAEKDLDE